MEMGPKKRWCPTPLIALSLYLWVLARGNIDSWARNKEVIFFLWIFDKTRPRIFKFEIFWGVPKENFHYGKFFDFFEIFPIFWFFRIFPIFRFFRNFPNFSIFSKIFKFLDFFENLQIFEFFRKFSIFWFF